MAKYYTPPHQPTGPIGGNAPSAPQQPASATAFLARPNPYPATREQKEFEKGLFEKTRRNGNGQNRSGGEIILFDNQVVLYKTCVDVTIYVVGSADENELILHSLLTAFYDAVNALLRHQVEKRAILENLDLIVLALDECVDDGIIIETDPTAIMTRISRPRTDSGDLQINEQTLIQAYETAKSRFAERILGGAF